MSLSEKEKARNTRKKRVRAKVRGTPEKPRINVFRSLKHIYVQLIDDSEERTVLAVSTLSPDLKGASGGNVKAAKQLGALLAKKALEKGIQNVVFDRNGFRYHGRVKAVADSAREGGLKF